MSHDELFKKYRPKNLDQVIGQPEAVAVLGKMIEKERLPHALLFVGPSGCGKTTLARIVTKSLKCGPADFTEMNAADARGIDTIRDIRNQAYRKPISGPVRVWVMDECHQLTPQAQNSFLKLLEDTPAHVYFMLCTTDPGKLIPTILNRCTTVKCKAIAEKELCLLIGAVLSEEKQETCDEVIEKIVELADGSARRALVLLEQVYELPTADEQLEALQKAEYKVAAIEIAKALLNPRTTWHDMAKILKSVEIDEPEQMRHMVLTYASKVLLGGGKLSDRAFLIVQAFRDNWFDSKRAGLIAACYEVIQGGS